MKNLFERLKPEHLQMLNDAEELYPLSTKYLKDELKDNYYWFDLKYFSVVSLLNNLRKFDYSPWEIEKLFNND